MTQRPCAAAAAVALLFASASCGHARPAGDARGRPGAAIWQGASGSQQPDPAAKEAARALSAEAHGVLRAEAELLWKRYLTGQGALPATAIEAHAALFSARSLALVAAARAGAARDEQRALSLLHGWLAPLSVTRTCAAEVEALDRARAALTFAGPGEPRVEHGERDLDRLLTDEASPQKRAALAEAEATAAGALAPLALARDKAEREALEKLRLPPWSELVEELHGASPEALARLAEDTLIATESVATRALSLAAQQSLGLPADRVRRADLPRLLRSAAADGEFPPGRGWASARAALGAADADPATLTASKSAASEAASAQPRILIDAEPAPGKGLRPLALLVDPPQDVRLSLNAAGGFEEQRALLHEGARASGGALTLVPRWELAQLGDGSAAEGAAQLFEQLAGNPLWLRETTQLRGEPLDEVVHASAARRLLTARRAAALVLFEVRRREGAQSAEATAALYRGLLQRATHVLFSDADAARWPLETDPWLRAATTLRAALLAAQLEQRFAAPAPATAPATAASSAPRAAVAAASVAPAAPLQSAGAVPVADAGANAAPGAASGASSSAPASGNSAAGWWHSPAAAAQLQALWRGGRSLSAEDAAQQLGLALSPAALAETVDVALTYAAPDPRPAAQRPDYKYMQGDRRVRRKKKRTH